MTVKDKYYIRVKSTLVEVTHEVYLAFYRAERQERNQVEKESRNHVTSYDAWDTAERTGQQLLTLPDEVNVEDLAISAVMSEKLHFSLRQLPESEQQVIWDIYFMGKTETETAKNMGIPLMTLRYRRDGILRKRKKMINQ